ncbi:MAG: transglutaminase domain-containing protein [Tepidisphaera sp.]
MNRGTSVSSTGMRVGGFKSGRRVDRGGLRLGIAALAVCGLAVSALAQNTAPGGGAPSPQKQPPAATPAAPAVKIPEPIEPGPYVRRTDLSYWAFTMHMRLYKGGQSFDEKGTRLSFRYDLPFETMTVVFPMLPETSGSVPRPNEAVAKLVLGGREVVGGNFLPPGAVPDKSLFPAKPEILERHFSGLPYHSGVKLAKLSHGELGKTQQTKGVRFQIDLPMMACNTVFDESKALYVPWPKGPWPAAANSTFLPQQWIDFEVRPDGLIQKYDDAVFKALIDKWLKGQDPKAAFTPVGLAKVLMGGMVKDIAPDINVLNYRLERPISDNTDPVDAVLAGATFLVGLQVRGAEYAAREKKVSEWDYACLGAAIFRRCGLPTRVVIGFDKRESEELEKGRELRGKVKAWFEFYLFDEANNTGNWVICDPYRLRKDMNQPPKLENPWKFFGSHDEMESVLPFAFQFLPPTDVRAYGAPAFWGWLVTPGTPTDAQTGIAFTARKTAVPRDAPKNRDNKGKPFK